MDNLVNLILTLLIIAGLYFAGSKFMQYRRSNKPSGGKSKLPGDPPPKRK